MVTWINDPKQILLTRWPNTSKTKGEIYKAVQPIIEEVSKHGDKALIEYTYRFDGTKLMGDSIKVSEEELENSIKLITEVQLRALKEAKRRLEIVEQRRLQLLNFTTVFDGVTVRSISKPISSVGCYVPGGRASYPSSLLMNVIPAKIADVGKVVVCTPPNANGEIDTLTLAAAQLCGVDQVFRVGGAQAIAALAFGTETIPHVDKIVGPGNMYVTAAKELVSSTVSIDKPAGPSEIVVLADETADPKLIILDLISQAEHGPGGLCGLVTDSKRLAEEVEKLLDERIKVAPKNDEISKILDETGFIYVTNEIGAAIEFVESIAPEHLEIMAEQSTEISKKITTAGLVLLGDYTPVAATDYCMGTNHVLPTGGYGRINSGLTVLDFVKTINVVESTKEGLEEVRENIRALSSAEGLPNHGLAVEGRFTS